MGVVPDLGWFGSRGGYPDRGTLPSIARGLFFFQLQAAANGRFPVLGWR